MDQTDRAGVCVLLILSKNDGASVLSVFDFPELHAPRMQRVKKAKS
jgi:hypothetical protein